MKEWKNGIYLNQSWELEEIEGCEFVESLTVIQERVVEYL